MNDSKINRKPEPTLLCPKQKVVADKKDSSTRASNAVPLGKGLQELIDPKKLRTANLYITHVAVESDAVSDLPGSGTASLILNCLGKCTPSNFGQRHSFPTAYSNLFATHAYVWGSCMKYLGHDIRKKSHDFKEENDNFLETLSDKNQFVSSQEYKNATLGKLLYKEELEEIYTKYLIRIKNEGELISVIQISKMSILIFCLFLITISICFILKYNYY